MSILSVVSPKGGVGKTTLALNLSFAFARRGWPTLLIDTDPQGGIGRSISGDTACSDGLIAAVAGEAPIGELVVATRLPELSILPFGRATRGAAAELSRAMADGALLERLFAACSERADLVLVDTPAGLGGITLGTARASTHLVAPLQAEPLALRALVDVVELVAELREEGRAVRLAGVIPNMVQVRQEVSLDVTREAYRMLPRGVVTDSFVPRDEAFLTASAEGVPLGLLGRRPPAVAAIFDGIAAELEPRIELIGEEDGHEPIPLLG